MLHECHKSSQWASKVYAKLLRQHGPQGWWPANSRFAVMVGAILTQNTAWSNVEKAIESLKVAGYLRPEAIANAKQVSLSKLIRSSGYFNVKAKRLQRFCEWYVGKGGYLRLRYWPTMKLRTELLNVYGIGHETADDILLYAFQRPVFVIDAYTRRIFSRLGVITGNESYDHLRYQFESQFSNGPKLLGEYHALIVRHGKDVCKPRPICENCGVRAMCNFFKVNH